MDTQVSIPIYDIYDLWYQPRWKETWFLITVYVVFATVLLTLILFGVYLYIKKKRRTYYWDAALYNVEMLYAEEYLLKELTHYFYAVLTKELKYYIKNRYKVDLHQKTDAESILFIMYIEDMMPYKDRLEQFFFRAGTYKFCLTPGNIENMLQDKALVLEIIRNTAPKKR